MVKSLSQIRLIFHQKSLPVFFHYNKFVNTHPSEIHPTLEYSF